MQVKIFCTSISFSSNEFLINSMFFWVSFSVRDYSRNIFILIIASLWGIRNVNDVIKTNFQLSSF